MAIPYRTGIQTVTGGDTVHLTAEDVAAFLDRRMTSDERHNVELHLADCDVCREEVAAVRRLLVARPVARPAMLVPAALVAAAAIAFVVITFNYAGPESAGERVRTPAPLPADTPQRLAVHSPAEGETIRRGRPVLSWSAVAGDPTYRLTLTNVSGQPVWSSTTTDTSVALPAHIELQSRMTYFWYVDALRADGRAASTGVRRFSIP